LHRRLGVAGAILAALMTLVGLVTAVGAVQRGAFDSSFLVIPMGSIVVFPALVGAALITRRQPETHKRLMLIATAELLSAGVARWPVVREWGTLGFYAMTDAFVAALLIHDIRTRRRPHPATVLGGVFFIASQPLRVAIGGTDAWLAFATWLAS
jgi:hypothetical protein